MAEFTPYLSEIRFLGGASTDFIEVVLDSGADPSAVSVVVYNSSGNVRSTNSLDATPDNTIAGSDVYTVETGVHKMGAVALVVDGIVVAFVSFEDTVTASGGPADGMTSTALGGTGSGESLVSTDMGASYSVDTSPDPGTIPCFLRGTPIQTPGGQTRVEYLAPGDRVWTKDNGAAPVIWAGSRRLSPAETEAAGLHPIRIPAGALGPGTPRRALMVSPAHRILVSDAALELLFGEREVLVAARHLVGWNGVRVAREVTAPEYFHLLFERHQLVRSNGLISESFHPQEIGLSALDADARAELFALFPALRYRPAAYGPTTRRCLRGYESRIVLAGLPLAA